MASWQAAALNIALHLTIKRVMSRTGTVAATRRFVESRRRVRLPAGCEATPVKSHTFHGEWIRSPESSDRRTLLYFPGGGFMLPASAQITQLILRINREAGTRGLLVHYRLAPEHPFPAGLDDCIAAYHHLLDTGTDPRSIVLAGWALAHYHAGARGAELQATAEQAVQLAERSGDDAACAGAYRVLAVLACNLNLEYARCEALMARVAAATARYGILPDGPPRPAHWGGYLIVPERVEFWQGRRSRLHDRLVYMRQFGGWHIERLAP